MPHCYIIAGPNGAGKTTASMTILPEILHCKEFVNADSIATGLSPLDPDKSWPPDARTNGTTYGRWVGFCYRNDIVDPQLCTVYPNGPTKRLYDYLAFLLAEFPQFAKGRVAGRVRHGGHNIPVDIIERRFYRGITNLFQLYMPICDDWAIINNMSNEPKIIAVGGKQVDGLVANRDIYNSILHQSTHDE